MSKKDKEQKKEKGVVYIEDLNEQVAATKRRIDQYTQQIGAMTQALEQERGILIHTEFILGKYTFPNRPKTEEKPAEEKPAKEKKPELEVK